MLIYTACNYMFHTRSPVEQIGMQKGSLSIYLLHIPSKTGNVLRSIVFFPSIVLLEVIDFQFLLKNMSLSPSANNVSISK